jgi:60 kDa SS-A/Ro ribonucleoprotein
MKTAYTKVGKGVKKKTAKQSEILDGQIANSSGCAVYKADNWKQLDRFLILGSAGGTYYIGEDKLTADNVKSIEQCIKEDGVRAVNQIVAVSDAGRAPSNDPAILALAFASTSDNLETRAAAFAAVPKVCRIGTHLFHFAQFREQCNGGWGRRMRRAIANWYNKKNDESVSYQIGKYQARDGWSHRDLLMLGHVKPADKNRSLIYQWASAKSDEVNLDELKTASPKLWAYEMVKKAETDKQVVALVDEFNLPLEMVPSEKQSKKVFELMLDNFKIEALMRNLGKLSSLEILKDGNFAEVKHVCDRLKNADEIKGGRLHPLKILVALKMYAQGHGMKGSLSWKPVQKVVDALDEAFYKAFDFVEPTGKRYMLALDISGSMSSQLAGSPISCAEGTGALAMVFAKREENSIIRGFASGSSSGYSYHGRSETYMMDLEIGTRDRLDAVVKKVCNRNFGSTDCALPFEWLIKEKIQVDAVIVMTDNETNHGGSRQPMAALRDYRSKMGVPGCKLIVIGMEANPFTIADPSDPNCLDIVGFDTSVPNVIADFCSDKM